MPFGGKSFGIIAAAGRGRRMDRLTDHTPKAGLPVAGRTNICRQMDACFNAGYLNFMVTVHHLAAHVQNIVRTGERIGEGVRVEYYWENPLIAPGLAARNIIERLSRRKFFKDSDDYKFKDTPFLFVTADVSMPHIDLAKFISAFSEALKSDPNLLGAICFILRPAEEIVNTFPTAIVNRDNRLVSYEESPATVDKAREISRKNEALSVTDYGSLLRQQVVPVDACLYAIKPGIFDEVEVPENPKENFDWGKYIFQKVDPRRIFCYFAPEPREDKKIIKAWTNITFPIDLWLAQWRFLLNVHKLREFHMYEYNQDSNVWFGKGSNINGQVRNSLVGNGVEIRRGARIGNSIIGHGCRIDNVDVQNTLVLPFTGVNMTTGASPVDSVNFSILGGRALGGSDIDRNTTGGIRTIENSVVTPQEYGFKMDLYGLGLSEEDMNLPSLAFAR